MQVLLPFKSCRCAPGIFCKCPSPPRKCWLKLKSTTWLGLHCLGKPYFSPLVHHQNSHVGLLTHSLPLRGSCLYLVLFTHPPGLNPAGNSVPKPFRLYWGQRPSHHTCHTEGEPLSPLSCEGRDVSSLPLNPQHLVWCLACKNCPINACWIMQARHKYSHIVPSLSSLVSSLSSFITLILQNSF